MGHRCNETMERLYRYLDRELTPDEQVQVQEHLDRCPPCRDRFHFEEDVLRLVRRCGRDLSAPPELVAKVRKMCDQEL
jgi:mycothiol system anti-sigma-R factor